MREYGVNKFIITQIDTASSKADLDIKEINYIALYNSTDKTKGYNISSGGASGLLGYHHTDSAKKKIGDASRKLLRTPEHCRWISESQRGHANHVQSSDEKLKRSESLKLAYAEGRHRVIHEGGPIGRKKSSDEIQQDSLRQTGKRIMYSPDLKIRSVVFKDDIPKYMKNGWVIGNPKHYPLIPRKQLNNYIQ